MNEEEKYIGKLLDDRYEILETIGEGGMALVFRALDLRAEGFDLTLDALDTESCADAIAACLTGSSGQ